MFDDPPVGKALMPLYIDLCRVVAPSTTDMREKPFSAISSRRRGMYCEVPVTMICSTHGILKWKYKLSKWSTYVFTNFMNFQWIDWLINLTGLTSFFRNIPLSARQDCMHASTCSCVQLICFYDLLGLPVCPLS